MEEHSQQPMVTGGVEHSIETNSQLSREGFERTPTTDDASYRCGIQLLTWILLVKMFLAIWSLLSKGISTGI
jgi:hypothetical protein